MQHSLDFKYSRKMNTSMIRCGSSDVLSWSLLESPSCGINAHVSNRCSSSHLFSCYLTTKHAKTTMAALIYYIVSSITIPYSFFLFTRLLFSAHLLLTFTMFIVIHFCVVILPRKWKGCNGSVLLAGREWPYTFYRIYTVLGDLEV